MELVFGLSELQLLECFYTMTMKEWETTMHFAIRVEQARRAVKATGASTFHAFVHKLDASVWLLLYNARVNKHANGGGLVTWDDIVSIPRDSLVGVSIVDVQNRHAPTTMLQSAAPVGSSPASTLLPPVAAATRAAVCCPYLQTCQLPGNPHSNTMQPHLHLPVHR